jgi:hypothetical protein
VLLVRLWLRVLLGGVDGRVGDCEGELGMGKGIKRIRVWGRMITAEFLFLMIGGLLFVGCVMRMLYGSTSYNQVSFWL